MSTAKVIGLIDWFHSLGWLIDWLD
jgi:hypothetical protein